MSDTPLVKKYIDSMDGIAHQSAIQIIIDLEKELAAANNRNTRNYYADGYEAGYQAGMEEKKPWVGLTNEDKNNCLVSADPCESLSDPEAQQLMKDVEAKLKDKNNG
jgi:flagellar biosynthesis/type III secretory pathway protein FliH